MRPASCLRCGGALERLTGGSEDVDFWSCAACGRQYARHGDVLTDRWGSPLSLALYGVIFDEHPEEKVALMAAQLRDHRARAELVADIDAELAHPTQPVARILPDMRAGEDALRAYLRRLAAALR